LGKAAIPRAKNEDMKDNGSCMYIQSKDKEVDRNSLGSYKYNSHDCEH
jgi:hypothetical protein